MMDRTINMAGKTVVVSGASSGIGFEAAQALAGMGANVVGIGRSGERCEIARKAVLEKFPGAGITFVIADLSSMEQVRTAAQNIHRIIASTGREGLDVLVNNAGGITARYTPTKDGYEMQFALNHLSPFLLTHELLPLLRSAPSARIITVSSPSHRMMRIFWADVMMRRVYNPLFAYKQSKLANVLFTCELTRQLQNSPICAYAVDPGLVNTAIGQKGTSWLISLAWKYRRLGGVAPAKGAETAIYLASEPSVGGKRDPYWKNCCPISPSRYALREKPAARLWALSERLCGISPGAYFNAGLEIRL